jgi:hypothetical protein
MEYAPFAKPYTAGIVKFFPVYSINNLIDVPFQRYVFREINDNIFWYEWTIVVGWIIIYASIITFFLNKRDLKAS